MRNILYFLKDYFLNAKNKAKVYSYIIICCLLKIANTLLQLELAAWFKIFFEAIASLSASVFVAQFLNFGLILLAILSCTFVCKWLSGLIAIKWQKFLNNKKTAELIKDLKENKKHPSDLPLNGTLTTNIKTLSEDTMEMILEFIGSVSNIVGAIASLWMLSGIIPLSILGLTFNLHGYLVWILFAFGLLTAGITQLVGRGLNKILSNIQLKEGDLKNTLQDLTDKSEAIKLEQGLEWYRKQINQINKDLRKLTKSRRVLESCILAVQKFYKYFSKILPYLAATPLLLAGLFDLQTFVQIGYTFDIAAEAITWFSRLFRTYSNAKLAADNLRKFEDSKIAPENNIQYTTNNENRISANINKSVNLTLNKSTLISGENGQGKSTFFKIINNATDLEFNGKVSMPPNEQIMTVPQHPTLPRDCTLKQWLIYPNFETNKTDDELKEILRYAGLDKYSEDLDNKKALSGGEVQLISLARILLKEPTWLFLDEATSALSDENQKRFYETIKQKLRDTKIISIGHRPGLEEFHDEKISEFRLFQETTNDSNRDCASLIQSRLAI